MGNPVPAPESAPAAASAAGAPRAPFNFKAILQQMVQRSASDLHLKVGRPPTLRINGDLSPLPLPALRPEDLSTLAKEIMTPKQVKEFAEFREADFATGVPGIGRFRVNAYQQRGTIAFAIRTVPHQAKSIQELNLPQIVDDIAMLPRGLVLVTGVTGSGKSTALASMLQVINEKRYANIITIEDPIEFLHRDIKCHINQREVGTDTGSFAQALRRVLRQDPDVILIGEIRDLDTLDTALKAADTGHLVFSTLHTTDATQTINRILSFYPPHQQNEVRFALSNALAAVVSLRLVPRADKPGRVPACEVLINTAAVREQIRDVSKTLNIPDLIKEGTVQYGMQSFDQSLMSWYSRGTISYENALFHATNPNELALRVQGVAGSSDTSWDEFQTDETA
ncbi:MAG: type IV pilus twitching motility protein PilT [Gemmatimonadetes bacterium]|nr:type IV pilus twitching motility protein PilT [Gemmatimonadota bacterium]HPV77155.1 type IV pilus twitching motility protein PilT [Gemmatimonadaceae bacterium]MBK6455626.1 type IV pilus twitching motility protein PilT [Gemmatimonadota bacterium]MBK7835500.1 type IV pilus twitching motility protein PilT [Gemmatimonadota bacterium]MBK8061892.1 type IV pilus twitching motility protein PilT [Gemmatimonadota bacterium]